MAMRTKTKKRVLILASVIVVLVIAGVILNAVRTRRFEAWVESLRVDGMAALERDDYQEAIANLGRYMRHSEVDPDPEALYGFAKARVLVPQPRGKHLVAAIQALRQAVDLDPGFVQAKRDLLELLMTVREQAESMELARDLSGARNDDAPIPTSPPEGVDRETWLMSLRALATLNILTRKFDRAEEAARVVTATEPNDLAGHFLLLRVLSRGELREVEPRVTGRIAELEADGKTDPRVVKLLRLAVYSMLGQPQSGPESELEPEQFNAMTLGILDELIADPLPDPAFLRALIQYVVDRKSGEEALAIVSRMSDGFEKPDLTLTSWIIRRLWEAGRTKEIIQRLADFDPGSRKMPAELIALEAQALRVEGRNADAAPLLKALADRGQEPVARAWHEYLTKVIFQENPELGDVVTVCQEALFRSPGNPYFALSLGIAYERMGENDLAVKAWLDAAVSSQHWAEPLMRILRLGLRTGKLYASRLARAGLDRLDESHPARRTVDEVLKAAALRFRTDARPEEYLAQVDKMNAVDDPNLRIPIQIVLLAKGGKPEEAERRLREMLRSDPVPPESALISLAGASGEAGLGMEEECFRTSLEAHGNSATLASAWALWLARQNRVAEAKKLVEKPADATGNVSWAIAKARFLSLIGDPAAKDAWIRTAEANPQNPLVLRAALESPVVWADPKDRPFIEKAIERLEKATGPAGLGWRMARARFLLTQEGRKTKEAATSAALLAEVLDVASQSLQAHLLMAQALQELGDVTGAIDSLEAARAEAPGALPILLTLARLHSSQGNTEKALLNLSLAKQSRDLTPGQMRAIILLYADLGEDREALAMLGRYRAHPSVGQTLDVARLYARCGKLDEALAICESLPSPSAEAVTFWVDILTTLGRVDEARELTARHQDLFSGSPTQKAWVDARMWLRTGDMEKAAESLRTVTREDAKDVAAWRTLAVALVSLGRLEEALATLEECAARNPDAAISKALPAGTKYFKPSRPGVYPTDLLVAWIDREPQREVTAEALDLFRRQAEGEINREVLLTGVKRMAEQEPGFLALQLTAAQLFYANGRISTALEIANTAMRENPRAWQPAKIAADCLIRLERWEEALGTLKRIMRFAPEKSLMAELMTAEAYLRTQRPGQALDLIGEDRFREAFKGERPNFTLIDVYVRSLITAQRTGEVFEDKDLRALLDVSPIGRAFWIRWAWEYVHVKESAVLWLDFVEKKIPADAVPELVILARGWASAAKRFGEGGLEPRFVEGCRRVLARAEKVEKQSAASWTDLALVHESLGDMDGAIADYRKALKLDPKFVVAMNNLAMALIGSGKPDPSNLPTEKELAEARALAEQVVAANPKVADFHDTLAQVCLSEGGDEALNAAIESLRKAVDLDPLNFEWRLRLGLALCRRGDDREMQEARELLRAVDRDTDMGLPNPPRIQALADELREKVRQK